jgi:HEAT repeat protein
MRHFAITLGTAAALVGAYFLLRSTGEGRPERLAGRPVAPGPIDPASRPVQQPASRPGPALVEGVSETEALHVRHGKVGEAMRAFLAVASGQDWNTVDRQRMQELIHAVSGSATVADLPYLLDLFNGTKDPAFRWWFSWLVQRIPHPHFVDAMTEVYRLDADRAVDALATINSPDATARFMKLFEAEQRAEVRQRAVVAIAHSDWPGKEQIVVQIAGDRAATAAERLEALGALGRVGASPQTATALMDLALGPPAPTGALTGHLAAGHPVADLRSGAVLALMTLGDQEAARRLIEAADAPGADPDFVRIVDLHLGVFRGPDLTELLFDRARRRGFVSAGEVTQLLRDLEAIDRSRLRDLVPLVRDAQAKALLEQVVSAR